MNVVYSAEAVDDLVRLREFIAVHNPQVAHRIANDLVNRIDQLCTFPEMGKQIPQFSLPSIRDFIFSRKSYSNNDTYPLTCALYPAFRVICVG